MSRDLSPAVERAADGATARAQGRDATLADWLLALIEDDDGKPAVLLAGFVESLESFRRTLATVPAPTANVERLYEAARQKALTLRSDPSLTTDVVLLAVLADEESFAAALAPHGVTVALVEAVLTPRQAADEASAWDAGPEFVIPEPSELLEAARVVDANLNRAREALRVLDDYARFVLDDAVLTEEFKRLRHDLVHAAQSLPATTLLAARDTPGDVGVSITTASEASRLTAAHVAVVNVKRLQESLRSLEEYGKILSATFAQSVETIRYRSYTLERAVTSRHDTRGRLQDARLYALLTGSQCVAALDWTIAELAAGGVEIVQLREKTLSDRELLTRAKRVRQWTRDAGVLFIVNDRPDIAALSQADGVHLGQDDLDVAGARRVVGPEAIVGVSTHTLVEVRQAVLDGADYLGVGPTFPSRTKSFEGFPGLDFVREVADATSLPAFALGGIDAGNVQEVVRAGLRRVAVSSALATADDPRAVAAQIRFALNASPERPG